MRIWSKCPIRERCFPTAAVQEPVTSKPASCGLRIWTCGERAAHLPPWAPPMGLRGEGVGKEQGEPPFDTTVGGHAG